MNCSCRGHVLVSLRVFQRRKSGSCCSGLLNKARNSILRGETSFSLLPPYDSNVKCQQRTKRDSLDRIEDAPIYVQYSSALYGSPQRTSSGVSVDTLCRGKFLYLCKYCITALACPGGAENMQGKPVSPPPAIIDTEVFIFRV